MASALQASDLKVGLYTSPHLHRWSERIRVQGRDIDLPSFISWVEALHPVAQRVQATVFELVTAVAFAYFQQQRVDVAVVEVGLGGRFDATNVVNPILSVITGIDLDHTDLLGDTVEQIAWEKAGIVKQGVPLICAPVPAPARRVVQEECRAKDAIRLDTAPCERTGFDWNAQTFQARGWGAIALPLLGSYQAQNLSTALAALEVLERDLRLDRGRLKAGVEAVRWPGRFELGGREPRVILDGAHNPQAAEGLRQTLEDYTPLLPPGARRWLLFGMRADKDYGRVAQILCPWFERILLAPIQGMHGLDPKQLLPYAQQHDPATRVFESATRAFGQFQADAHRADLLCVTGSFYLVGEVRWLLSIH